MHVSNSAMLAFIFLAVNPTATPVMDNIWQVVAQSGFNAILVVLLLYYGRQDLKEIRREMREQRRAQDRNTKLVTIALLQLATLIPGVKGQLTAIKSEIEEVEHDDVKEKDEL